MASPGDPASNGYAASPGDPASNGHDKAEGVLPKLESKGSSSSSSGDEEAVQEQHRQSGTSGASATHTTSTSSAGSAVQAHHETLDANARAMSASINAMGGGRETAGGSSSSSSSAAPRGASGNNASGTKSASLGTGSGSTGRIRYTNAGEVTPLYAPDTRVFHFPPSIPNSTLYSAFVDVVTELGFEIVEQDYTNFRTMVVRQNSGVANLKRSWLRCLVPQQGGGGAR